MLWHRFNHFRVPFAGLWPEAKGLFAYESGPNAGSAFFGLRDPAAQSELTSHLEGPERRPDCLGPRATSPCDSIDFLPCRQPSQERAQTRKFCAQEVNTSGGGWCELFLDSNSSLGCEFTCDSVCSSGGLVCVAAFSDGDDCGHSHPKRCDESNDDMLCRCGFASLPVPRASPCDRVRDPPSRQTRRFCGQERTASEDGWCELFLESESDEFTCDAMCQSGGLTCTAAFQEEDGCGHSYAIGCNESNDATVCRCGVSASPAAGTTPAPSPPATSKNKKPVGKTVFIIVGVLFVLTFGVLVFFGGQWWQRKKAAAYQRLQVNGTDNPAFGPDDEIKGSLQMPVYDDPDDELITLG